MSVYIIYNKFWRLNFSGKDLRWCLQLEMAGSWHYNTLAFPLTQRQKFRYYIKMSCYFSAAQLCLTLCNPMDCSTPCSSVLHDHLELAQSHVHWVDDTIQPSHPLPSPSPAFNLPSIRVFSNESALPIRWPKYWSFSFSITVLPMTIQDWFPLGLTGWISL